MPVLQPAEPWRKTGRYAIEELFKLQDRKGSELVLAMTHEEAVTTHVAQTVRSYRDLPLILYHFQVKERDEPRPRAGVLRTREFIMKDAYTFDRDAAGLDERYELHVGAYDRIMERTGLRWYRVEADVGMMGGTGAHEYMAPCPAGENEVALAPRATPPTLRSPAPKPSRSSCRRRRSPPRRSRRPESPRSPRSPARSGVPEGALLKAYPVVLERRRSHGPGARARRPPRQRDQARRRARRVQPSRAPPRRSPRGSARPVSSDRSASTGAWRSCSTRRAAGASRRVRARYVTGANRPDAHLLGVVPGRDFPFRAVDVRTVCAGDTVGGRPLTIEPAIEVGNIFKLGTRYSLPLGANFLDESGREQPIWMGCYGIGPARIAAAAVEQYADEHGISWPRALAPFEVHLVAVGKPGSPGACAAEELYETLRAGGVEVLYDDRDAGPGEKFADAELLGCPVRLTVGKRTIESGEIEVQVRRGREAAPVSLASEPRS